MEEVIPASRSTALLDWNDTHPTPINPLPRFGIFAGVSDLDPVGKHAVIH